MRGFNLYKLHENPQELIGFDKAMQIPKIAWDYYRDNPYDDIGPKKLKELQKLEHLWAKDPYTAYKYAYSNNRSRFPAGEPAILTDFEWAFEYARDIMKLKWPALEELLLQTNVKKALEYCLHVKKRRWPALEQQLLQHPRTTLKYTKEILKRRWPEAEVALLNSTDPSKNIDLYWYAKNVIKGRWPAAEQFIKVSPWAWAYYGVYDNRVLNNKAGLTRIINVLTKPHNWRIRSGSTANDRILAYYNDSYKGSMFLPEYVNLLKKNKVPDEVIAKINSYASKKAGFIAV